MKNRFSLVSLVLFFYLNSFAQTVIDYQAWSGASGCNIFASSTNVPATINGSNGNVVHLSLIGQPEYFGSGTDAVALQCFAVIDNSGNTTGYKGTEYRISYNFKQGSTYQIKVIAQCINSSGASSNANLRLQPHGSSSGGSNQCNGPDNISSSTSGNLIQSISPGNSFTEYTLNWSAFSSALSFLNVAAVPPIGSGNQTILIRKITIIETSSAELVLSPTSLATTCGSTISQTFTVTNPNNVQNITSYEWNLGSSSNGWIYNGSAAPQNISTTSNSLSLTSTCGAVLQNVQVTVRVNNANYKTYTCNVSSTNPTISISGSNNFCSSESYSISNLPCNASVSWSASPSGIVSFSSTTSTNPTVTKITDGVVTLYATITNSNACNSATINKELVVTVGTPKLIYASSGAEAFNLTGQNFNYGANGPGNSFSVCPSENLSFTPFVPSGYAPTIYAHSWTISGSYSSVGSLNQPSLDVTSAASPYNNFSFTYQYQNACGWSPLYYGTASTIDCAGGQEPFRVKFEKGLAEEDSSLITGISMYPNPVRDRLIISLDKRIAGIKIIRLVDATGRSISSQQITGHTTTINFSGLANGIYYVEINQGKKRFIRKVIK
jgi:hypothetical protein